MARWRSSAESGIPRRTVTGELVLLVRRRFSFRSRISLSPFETVSVPSWHTYIFSCGKEDRAVPPPGAITEALIQRSEEGPASRPRRRTSAMFVVSGRNIVRRLGEACDLHDQ